ncbi:cysteine proteinase [Violaceomyces palustris]|uniref:Cysteine proteinase n=1 Tax=Violaceomyces palustris TaxID=1673888 RepID=A0ACD0P589_9BASI|nr:cysteine proteinase [Violaceomyces palustris]
MAQKLTEEPVDSVTNPPARPDKEEETTVDIRLDQVTGIDPLLPRPTAHPSIPPPPPPPYHQDVSLLPSYSQGQLSTDPFRCMPERKMTPIGSYHLLLPTALHDSKLVFDPTQSLIEVWAERDDSTPSPSTVNAPLDAASNSNAHARIPSIEEVFGSKPSPGAMFVPEALEWKVVEDEKSIRRGQPDREQPVMDFDGIFEACGLPPKSVSMYETVPVTILAKDQRWPITILPAATESRTTPTVLEEFNTHTCWVTGKKIVSTAPGAIPSVIDRETLLSFRKNREANPNIGVSPAASFIQAAKVLLKIIGNAIHGETRPIPLTAKTVTQKLGWDQITRDIFQQLGWKIEPIGDGREGIIPPSFGKEAETEQLALSRNIRAWLEMSVWTEWEAATRGEASVKLSDKDSQLTKVRTQSAHVRICNLIGLRSEDLVPLSSFGSSANAKVAEAFFCIGASPSSKDELVKLAYLVNTEISPIRASELLSSIETIHTLDRSSSQTLHELIVFEKSKGRYTTQDIDSAYQKLQLTPEFLGDDIERSSIPHDFIVDQYRARAREALSKGDSSDYQAAKDSLRTISNVLGKPPVLEEALSAKVEMDTTQAYELLGLSRELDDTTLLAVFEMRLEEAPGRSDMLKEAFRAIVEEKNSDFLRNYLETGTRSGDRLGAEAGWQEVPSNDRPAGINNIGNTCYLNSVLQYFFTIREIRDRVLAAAEAGPQEIEKEAKRRVGGRQVSVREIERSRKFVLELAGLFKEMIYSPALAVTPERELAYLALVSSRAEEDEEAGLSLDDAEGSGGAATGLVTDSTISSGTEGTDKTLVDEPGSISPVQMRGPIFEVEPSTNPSLVEGDSAAAPSSHAPVPDEKSAESSADKENVDPTNPHPSSLVAPPPLPPRPKRGETRAAPARRNSLMQLGAQQDVSECLDNCMFQLEVALGTSTSEPTSPMEVDEVKLADNLLSAQSHDLLPRLFLGKTCQRLQVAKLEETKGASSVHVKKEVFKILPVDVLEEGRDLYDGLDGFFDEETLLGSEGKPLTRTVTLLEPPPILQIQLQRVQYDRLSMRAYKSQAHLDMDQTLYMDRYLDFDAANPDDQPRLEKKRRATEARKKIASLRNRLRELKPPASTPVSQKLRQTASFLRGLKDLPSLDEDFEASKSTLALSEEAGEAGGGDGGEEKLRPDNQTKGSEVDDQAAPLDALSSLVSDEGLALALENESKALEKEVEEMERTISETKKEMNEIWKDEKRVEYQLASIFMHRGEASHGHYFLNQRKLPIQEDGSSKWFKYNDSAVSEVELSEVLRDTSGATPYLVSYVRKDLMDHLCLIETVRRQIVENPFQPTLDPDPVDDQKHHHQPLDRSLLPPPPPPPPSSDSPKEMQLENQKQQQPQVVVSVRDFDPEVDAHLDGPLPTHNGQGPDPHSMDLAD